MSRFNYDDVGAFFDELLPEDYEWDLDYSNESRCFIGYVKTGNTRCIRVIESPARPVDLCAMLMECYIEVFRSVEAGYAHETEPYLH